MKERKINETRKKEKTGKREKENENNICIKCINKKKYKEKKSKIII